MYASFNSLIGDMEEQQIYNIDWCHHPRSPFTAEDRVPLLQLYPQELASETTEILCELMS